MNKQGPDCSFRIVKDEAIRVNRRTCKICWVVWWLSGVGRSVPEPGTKHRYVEQLAVAKSTCCHCSSATLHRRCQICPHPTLRLTFTTGVSRSICPRPAKRLYNNHIFFYCERFLGLDFNSQNNATSQNNKIKFWDVYFYYGLTTG